MNHGTQTSHDLEDAEDGFNVFMTQIYCAGSKTFRGKKAIKT